MKRHNCTNCLTGKQAYELDKLEPVCPYIYFYTDKSCPFYVKIKKGLWDRIKSIIK